MTAFNITGRIDAFMRSVNANTDHWQDTVLRGNAQRFFGDLAPKMTDAELEAKIARIAAKTPWREDAVANAIRREFSTVACGDGVDWKAKCEAAEKKVAYYERFGATLGKDGDAADRLGKLLYGGSFSVTKLLGGSNAAILSDAMARIESAERERDVLKQSYNEAATRANTLAAERDALAARVKELEAKQEGLLPINAELIVKEREDCWRKVSRSLANHLAAIAEMEARKAT